MPAPEFTAQGRCSALNESRYMAGTEDQRNNPALN